MDSVQPYTVLLADDDENIRELLSQYLIKKGYIVTAVADGKEALEKFNKFHFDFCVLDINMPYLTGIQLVDEIKKTTSDIQVVFITGVATDEEIEEIYNENKGLAIVKKPFRCQSVGNYLAMMSEQISIHEREKFYRKSIDDKWKSMPLSKRLFIIIKNIILYLHESFLLYIILIAMIVSMAVVQIYSGVNYISERATYSKTLDQMYKDMKEMLEDWKVKDIKQNEESR